MGVLLKVSEHTVEVSILKSNNLNGANATLPAVHGITYAHSSKKSSKAMRLITIVEDGSTNTFNVSSLSQGDQAV